MLSRREFIRILGLAGSAGMIPQSTLASAKKPSDIYEIPKFGNVCLMHFTDCHAQLLPIYFREPSLNLGLGRAYGQPPHLVGERLLRFYGIEPGGREAHAFSYLHFAEAAKRYGKIGGFSYLATLIQQIRASRNEQNCLLMDGGDTWQGSATAYWTRGKDMVDACNILGVDIMTGHWEYTYHDSEIMTLLKRFKGEMLAQNIRVKEEALFDGAPTFDEDTGHAFKPYTIRTVGETRVAVIGQAFPYTPIANPQRFIPNWTFGIQDKELQSLVDDIREKERSEVVVLLSHNGMDVDLKLASLVSGIDVIFGGHTHDAVPAPTMVRNPGGKTLVTNAGSNGKFLGVMDLDVRGGHLRDYRYRLVPIFSHLLKADEKMEKYIHTMRAPYISQLNEKLAVADQLLYRRGNFNGTFDQLICDGLRAVGGADIALSPGFRWGTTVLPGQTITMERIMDQTAMTYPETYVREMTGANIKLILEDVADNLFHPDPYYQQGGDMVRVGGLDYTCDPSQRFGKRISEMHLDNGKRLEPSKKYKVAGWATVGSKSPGPPVWEVIATYLKNRKSASISKLNVPRLKNVEGNPGLASP